MLPLSPVATLGLPPVVRNLSAVDADEPFAAVLSFDVDQLSDAEDYRVAVYIDGQLVRILAQDQLQATIGGLFGTNLRIDAIVFPIWEHPPDMLGHFGADSAYVTWPWITDADLAAVDVYRASSVTAVTGGFALVSPVLVGRVDKPIVEHRAFARPDSNDPHGRITTWGGVSADFRQNGVYTLTISAAGVVDWDGFGESGSIDFDAGEVIQLPAGVSVRFDDAVSKYVTADVYTIHVGIPNYYQTGTLPEGLYYFGRKAIDRAGNVTSGSVKATEAIKIVYEPGAVTDVAMLYDDSNNGEALIAWTDPADVDLAGVRVYSNYDPVTGTLDEFVYEDTPLAEVLPEVGAYSIPNLDGLVGLLRVYLRPVDADGFENESIAMLTMALPPVPASIGLFLGEVTLLTAEPAAGGNVLASWAYYYQTENDTGRLSDLIDDATGFAYWIDTSEPDFSTAPDGILTPTATTFPLAQFEALISTAAATGTTLYLAIRATDGAGHYGAPETFVTVIADATAPAITTFPQGVTN